MVDKFSIPHDKISRDTNTEGDLKAHDTTSPTRGAAVAAAISISRP